MRKILNRIIALFVCFVSIFCFCPKYVQINYANSVSLKEWFENTFFKPQQQQPLPEVYVGGIPLGFTLECDGVIVIAVGNVHTEEGVVSTIKEGSIENGDVITQIDNIKITSVQTINDEMKKQEKENREVSLLVKGKTAEKQVKILPAKDVISDEYKLGLWVRDNSAGVGTLTYVKDNGEFGALGHSVCDIDTGTVLPVRGGGIYKCNIIGVETSKRGSAGELKGLFLRNGAQIGRVDKNTDAGVFGVAEDELKQNLNLKLPVARKNQVKTGRASILCAIEGTEAKEYSIEIIKTTKQNSLSTKSMVIRITDEELINKTGGIVQGMSGSPIIQNGMLVGAVTHVFVSDPTKGYGIYAEWMVS